MKDRRDEELDIWPAIADFKLALFMIALSIGMAGVLLALPTKKDATQTEGIALSDCDPDPNHVVQICKDKPVKCYENYKACLGKVEGANREPPFVEYYDSEGRQFDKGKATLNQKGGESGFTKKLHNDLFPNLVAKIAALPPRPKLIEGIEIVGHTDPDDIGDKISSLDLENLTEPTKSRTANLCWYQTFNVDTKAGSNADLGLMRALVVAQAWKVWLGTLGEQMQPMRDWAEMNKQPDFDLETLLKDEQKRKALFHRLQAACPIALSAAYGQPARPAEDQKEYSNAYDTGRRPTEGKGRKSWDDKARRIELRFIPLAKKPEQTNQPAKSTSPHKP